MAGERAIAVRSPYTGEVVGEVAVCSAERVRAALQAGAQHQGRLSRYDRSALLQRVSAALLARREPLARLISSESGLCLKDTLHEVARAAEVFRLAAAEVLHDDGESYAGDISPNGRDRRGHTLRVPLRLVGAITPFNHPVGQVAHKLAPAIAAGTPIVLKPSEKLGLIRQAGLAPPAAQLVCGEPDEVLDAFLEHPAVELLGFTGSVSVGKAIAARLGYRRAMLELGGNDPLIVLADADLEEAAALAVSGAFANSGQRCTAVKRIIAVAQIADELAERVAARALALRCGDPLDPATDVGTVIDERAAETIQMRIRDAIASGARLLAGGDREGALITPTVLDGVSPEVSLVAEETFGPVAPIIRVRDLDEAIATANATPYALSSGVCTFDWRAIARCVRELRAGTVNVREVPGWRTELTPFGGFADSGLGIKEGVREAMRAMSNVKLYTLPWD